MSDAASLVRYEPQPQAVCGFTPDDFVQVLGDLLPQGWVWPRDPDSVQQQFLAGLALELARIATRDCDLLEESYPCGALETITDWERVLGLPDPCTGLLGTLQQRRAAICAKISTVGGSTLEAMQSYLRSLGFDVDVEEGPGRFDWMIWTVADTPVWFRAGQSTCTESIRIWGNEMLECGIEYIKPAHTRPVLIYLVPSEWDDEATEWDGGDSIWDYGVRPPR